MSPPREPVRTERPIVPSFTVDDAARLLLRHWGIRAVPEPLPSYVDQNFRVTDDVGEKWVLKIANGSETRDELDFQNAVMSALAEREPDLAPVVQPSPSGRTIEAAESDGVTHFVRLVSFMDGDLWEDADHVTAVTWRSLGAMLGRVDRALDGLTHPAMHRGLRWDLTHAVWTIAHQHRFGTGERAARIARAQREFLAHVVRVMNDLPHGVIHGDANPGNVCVRDTPAGAEVTSIFDFGDVAHAPRVFEVAIAAAYAVLGRDNVLEIVREIARGSHDVRPFTEAELDALFPALCMRLVVSLTVSERDAQEDPDNEYVAAGQQEKWDALARLERVSPAEASAALRSACGFEVPSREYLDRDDAIDRRRRTLGRGLSLSYRRPLEIARGRLQYLFDKDDRAYLDMVNNVCHVGHCHPRVVDAARRQIATLNTNTRYLHDTILRYAERLTAASPDPLNVCYFVNSGTEANELALRLARAATGRSRMLAVDHGYHGHSSAMIDLSAYKHDGPGGRGKPEWLHRVPCPDTYRGRYTGDDASTRYAEHVSVEIERAKACGREIAGFIVEPIIGCGGQIVPPDGYLADAFARARAGGVVCIADEVQIGFGRVGTHMWASAAQGAVPDILTLGKPIGNGHPMAAVVTTEEIADAFDPGMEFFSTFGGNPVSCAIGLAVLDVIDEDDLLSNARSMGAALMNGFREVAERHEAIGDVRGAGLFLGVEVVSDRGTKAPAASLLSEVIERSRNEGVLLSADGPDRNVLKIKPPMCIARSDVEFLLAVFERSLRAALTHG